VSSSLGILIVSLIGVYLTKKRILSTTSIQLFSKLIEQIFLPCLIFSSFIKTLELSDFSFWVPPTVSSIMSILIGCALGYTSNRYILKEKNLEQLIILACGLG
jgi:predicted permease